MPCILADLRPLFGDMLRSWTPPTRHDRGIRYCGLHAPPLLLPAVPRDTNATDKLASEYLDGPHAERARSLASLCRVQRATPIGKAVGARSGAAGSEGLNFPLLGRAREAD
jgi:hypothetical protein